MIRSFAYMKHVAWRDHLGGELHAPMTALPPPVLSPEREEVPGRLQSWEDGVVPCCSERYLARTSLYPELDQAMAQRIIRRWTMEKALTELRYELKHRPANSLIPFEGILSLAASRTISR